MNEEKTNATTPVGKFLDAINLDFCDWARENLFLVTLDEKANDDKFRESEIYREALKRCEASIRSIELEIAKAILETAQEIILNRKEYPLDPKYFLPFGERDDWKGVAK